MAVRDSKDPDGPALVFPAERLGVLRRRCQDGRTPHHLKRIA
ncbi:DUF397 domain-containing protein [Streptomyces sp. FH025]|nr:DUF397 domain-containing protein [Streptomyces sp. FH025]